MKMLRINLRIRSDVSPRLYAALIDLPPRPRAELLRRLADIGLTPTRVTTPPPAAEESGAVALVDQDSERDVFGKELLRVVADLP